MGGKIKIWHWGRNGRICHIVYQESEGTMQTRDFPAKLSDEAIMTELTGAPASSAAITPPVQAAGAEPAAGQPVQAGRKCKRSQMIAALDAAGIRDYDQSKLQSVKTAYDSAVKTGRIKTS